MPLFALATPSAAGLIQILVVLIVCGVVLWLIQTYVPMAAPIKTVITVVVVLVLCLWLLQWVGVL